MVITIRYVVCLKLVIEFVESCLFNLVLLVHAEDDLFDGVIGKAFLKIIECNL